MAKRNPAIKQKTRPAPKPKHVEVTAIIDPNEISPQMLLFVDHYIVCMNGTEAARLAEYSGDDATLAATASRLLRNNKVLREIERRLATFSMSANEVLIHLTDIARGDIADALNSMGGIDPLEAKRRGKSHLIKRFKTKTVTVTSQDGKHDTDSYEAEVEMYDRLDALKVLAKFHSLLIDRVKVEDWRTDIIALLKDGKVTPEQVQHELGRDLAQELFNSIGLQLSDDGEGRANSGNQ